MAWSFVLPVFLGFSIVIQGGLNRLMARGWSLTRVTLINALVLSLVSLLFCVPEMLRGRSLFANFGWWYWIPGCVGFCIVAGIPFAIGRIGALQTIVLLIAAQIVGSMGWDALVEDKPMNLVRLAGALITCAGAALVTWKG